MDIFAVIASMEAEHKLFAAGAVITGGLTVGLVALGSPAVVQQFLFGSFALYLLGAAYPDIDEHVAEYKRTGAMALGGIGLLAYLAGTASALPLLFVVGGIAALLRLF